MTPKVSMPASLFSRRLLAWVHDAVLAAAAAANAMVNRYEAGRALSRFDERMLADIGLTANDVSAAFSEPIWRDPTRRLAVMAIERRLAARAARRIDLRSEERAQPAELVAD